MYSNVNVIINVTYVTIVSTDVDLSKILGGLTKIFGGKRW